MTRKYHSKPVTHIGLVNLKVSHLEHSLSFYEQVIGYQVLAKNEHQAILTVDGKSSALILQIPKNVNAKPSRTTGLYHFALLLPTRNDLANFLQHLLTLNIPFGASDHGVSEAIYLDDPDGNGIEVYCDRPDTSWKRVNGGIHMTTERLDGEDLLQEVDDNWSLLPQDTRLGHIHLHVKDLIETKHFYKEGLGFDLITEYPGALFMSDGGYHHHLGLNVWQGEGAIIPPKNSVGLSWFSLVLANAEKRDQIKQQLKQINAKVTVYDDYYETQDPSGNVIRLVL